MARVVEINKGTSGPDMVWFSCFHGALVFAGKLKVGSEVKCKKCEYLDSVAAEEERRTGWGVK